MTRSAVAFVVGVLFAVGLGVSGMTHPSKILAFLDVTGHWDPSLAFVMGGGVLVNFIVFRFARRRGAPLFAASFTLSPRSTLDAPLILGAIIFGVGWGISGFCPGPALVSLAGGSPSVIAFVLAMVTSMLAYDAAERKRRWRRDVTTIGNPPAGVSVIDRRTARTDLTAR